ncbi:MAG: 4-hydroxy-tetrahydrodipicolinate synthase [Myxococcaceae bacterium]
MRTFEGPMVALATPFRGGALDEEAYRALIGNLIDNGITGLVPIGTTGEAVTLTPEERARAVKLSVEVARGRVPVLAGAGSNSTAETIWSVASVRESGADGALVVTPYYNKPTQAGLVHHYKLIAKAHPGFPLVAYNVPGRTGVDLLPETCERLCEIPEVVALKEATGSASRAVDIVERCGDRLTLLSGDDFTVLPVIACGGKGAISVSGNVVPRMLADLVKASRAGELPQARELQVKMNGLHRALFSESNPIPVKWALHLLGRFGPEIRSPLLPMSEGPAARLEAELVKLGLLAT